MQKNVLRFFFGLLAIVMLSVAIIPASAADGSGGGAGRSDFFTWTDGFGGGSFGGGAGRKQSKAAYDAYVETLPAPGYTSDNGLIWQPTIADVDHFTLGNSSLRESDYTYDSSVPCIVLPINRYSGNPSDYEKSFTIHLKAPISASYIPLNSRAFSYYVLHQSGETSTGEGNYNLRAAHFVQGAIFSPSMGFNVPNYQYIRFECFFPVYKLIPDVSLSGDTYNTTTRPGSLVGLYGDVNGEAFSNNSATIVNETNNTYYNPATGATVPITGWSYDYSDRSYKVTLESGDTATITYGDENITIQEGDTIYNVYYLIDGSGSENPPSACEHDWQKGEAMAPTCVRPGSASYACSKCQQTKTETIPALGHNWQLKQTVTTQYDDTGQLVQQGYTIFECSTCHEQYKSTDGTIPPGGGSGTDPGGDEGETIWDKLGNLIGAIGGGMIGLIDAALGKVLDALIVLAEKMMEKLKVVVETVLSIFDELPLLFGGFLDFLVAVFPFLPPELMTILTFGVIAIVFIGIIKAVRR